MVDHGPFPLASLKAFNLAPAMASVHHAGEKRRQPGAVRDSQRRHPLYRRYAHCLQRRQPVGYRP
ncbi:hypothetical protein LNP05_16120 [Klebsiella pneumoniae subsp. pneumoniae]|nr:hypothetical protein [Klebsiella pneumoniae subsp. pneumoniae]